MSDEERFWSKVEKTDGCWLWQGQSRNGYGLFFWGSGKNQRSTGAHRYAYRLTCGEIPEGLVLDHLCRVPLCVNPQHLEPVTRRENVLRGIGAPAVNRVKTHCDNGHEFTPENTYLTKGGARNCRACGRDRANRRFWEKGYRPASGAAKKRVQEAMSRHPELSTAQLAVKLGWSHGYVQRIKRELREV
ncbi:HNH endonuclease signature motif containing protein [Streptomyces sp. NPDC094143]|jgi:hypothetical protein|uniref:HNH endonuclease signature motif containing protein n=1 Tax=Streptomyces sp. NPDC094143 TaxID=3155310 RepID=UPI00332C23A2